MYVCIYIYMYVCMYVCIHIHIYRYTYPKVAHNFLKGSPELWATGFPRGSYRPWLLAAPLGSAVEPEASSQRLWRCLRSTMGSAITVRKPVACNCGLLWLIHGLLWGMEASGFGLLGFPGNSGRSKALPNRERRQVFHGFPNYPALYYPPKISSCNLR